MDKVFQDLFKLLSKFNYNSDVQFTVRSKKNYVEISIINYDLNYRCSSTIKTNSSEAQIKNIVIGLITEFEKISNNLNVI